MDVMIREEDAGLIAQLWQEGRDIDKQVIARSLLESVVVNLDKGDITDYTLCFQPTK